MRSLPGTMAVFWKYSKVTAATNINKLFEKEKIEGIPYMRNIACQGNQYQGYGSQNLVEWIPSWFQQSHLLLKLKQSENQAHSKVAYQQNF